LTDASSCRYLYESMQEIIVPHDVVAKKLENFLKKEFPIGYIRKLFRKNGVRLNGKRAKPEDPIHADDRVQLYIPFEAKGSKPKVINSLPELDTIYEDENLLVINKPAGVAVHEGKTVSKRDSVAGLLEKNYRDSKLRPMLVHRLDKDTSGLLLLAKNLNAKAVLEKQFEAGTIDKQYLCLVAGRLNEDSAKIDTPLPGRDGKPTRAVTHYHVVKRFGETTLVKVNIDTGRLHQIRLHFAELSHPVVMDDQHGDFNFNKRFRKQFGLKRQFLHAAELTLNFVGKRHTFRAKLPRDLEKTVGMLDHSE
jgi:23S rRNA pseudouridine955/2504/2580 synthase